MPIKFFFLLFNLKSEAMISPHFELLVKPNNKIELLTSNDFNKNLDCTYSVIYFENQKKFQRIMGSAQISSNSKKNIFVSLDPYSKISNLRASVECDN